MKSVICHSAKDLRIDNTELPPLGEHQLRVNVAYANDPRFLRFLQAALKAAG